MTVAPGERIDRLYELPLDEFIPERNALAAELRRAGERDAAAEVKTLRKPSRVASAVNRLVRAERVESAEKRAEAARAGLREAQDALAALEHGRSAR